MRVCVVAVALLLALAGCSEVSLARRLVPTASGGSFAYTPPTETLHALFNGTDDGGTNYDIGAATSSDEGLTWSQYGSNPVLSAGTGWEAVGVKDPHLHWDGSQYVMLYSGYASGGSDYLFQMGRATAASHEGPWTKDPGNPVLAKGGTGADDEYGLEIQSSYYSAAAHGGHAWWAWYVQWDSASAASYGVAYSDDGTAWTKAGTTTICPQAVYYAGGTWYFAYSLSGDIGLATAASPTGTYTAYSGNPIITKRSGVGVYVSATIASSASSGSTVITINSGEGDDLEAGELVLLAGTGTPETNRVVSTTATTITLDTATTATHGAGDVVRAFRYSIVDARTLRRRNDGTFEIYGASFRTLDGLTTSGQKLWEAAFRYSAPAITGPWTVDPDLQPMFPLSPATTGWDKFSAENPSVVPAP